MTMSKSRFNAVLSGMTTTAKKVFDAVPIQKPWNTAMIMAELQRVGVGMDYRTVAGCLNTLLRAGLVCEPTKGEFKREAVREQDNPTDKPKEPSMPAEMKSVSKPIITITPRPTPVDAVAKPLSPLDRLGELAERTVAMAAMLQALASDIGDAAVEIQSQLEANEENVAKMRQLSMLLKSLDIAA